MRILSAHCPQCPGHACILHRLYQFPNARIKLAASITSMFECVRGRPAIRFVLPSRELVCLFACTSHSLFCPLPSLASPPEYADCCRRHFLLLRARRWCRCSQTSFQAAGVSKSTRARATELLIVARIQELTPVAVKVLKDKESLSPEAQFWASWAFSSMNTGLCTGSMNLRRCLS